MAIKILSSIELPQGFQLANLIASFSGSYAITKHKLRRNTEEKTPEYRVIATATAKFYISDDKPFIKSQVINIQLNEPDYEKNIMGLLYAELKRLYPNNIDC